jgi:hypothetical protein
MVLEVDLLVVALVVLAVGLLVVVDLLEIGNKKSML